MAAIPPGKMNIKGMMARFQLTRPALTGFLLQAKKAGVEMDFSRTDDILVDEKEIWNFWERQGGTPEMRRSYFERYAPY